MQNPRTNKMETVPVNKLLFSLSLPIMFSMMIQALYNIIDSIFIARFSEKALSAVSLTFPMQTLMIAIGVGTCVGINAFLSRTLGQKNFGKALLIAQHGMVLILFSYLITFLAGLFFSCRFFEMQTMDTEIIAYGTDYMSICFIFSIFMYGQLLFEKFLQANGHAFLSMISQLTGAVVNIVLDAVLIFGLAGFPALGTKGAAIATVIGQCTACFIAFILNQHCNKEIKLSAAGFHFNMNIIREVYKIGLPAIIMQSVGSLSNFLLNGILLDFSETATALLGIYYKLQNFVFMPVYGLTSGMLPIMSYNMGARLKERVKGTLYYGMGYMSVIMLTGTAVFQMASSQLLGLFGASGEIYTIGLPALRIISIYFIFEGFCLISQTCFQALGRGMASLICSMVRQIIILIPAAYILSLGKNIDWVWIAYPVAGSAGVIVCVFFWKAVYKKNILSSSDSRMSKRSTGK